MATEGFFNGLFRRLVHSRGGQPAGKLVLGDQINRVTIKPIRQEQKLIVGDSFSLLFDGFELIWCQGTAQSARFEAGDFNRDSEFTGRPAVVVSTSADCEPIGANELLGVGIGCGSLARGQSVLQAGGAV